jgi:hypothetical protein
MDGQQALAVMMLRDWFEGRDGRERVTGTFAAELGLASARAAVTDWKAYAELIATGTRRPVMCHALHCRCVGSDEAVLAHVLCLAAEGAREDAMFVLSLLVQADRLLPALTVVERAGLAVKRLATCWRLNQISQPAKLH